MFPTVEELHVWAAALDEVEDVLASPFERAEPRQRAMRYVRGLRYSPKSRPRRGKRSVRQTEKWICAGVR